MKKKLIMIPVVLLALLVFGWRLYPHPFSTIFPPSVETIHSIYAYGTVKEAEEDPANQEFYELDDVFAGTDLFNQFMEVLTSADYRLDLRNLIPGEISSVESTERAVVRFTLNWGDGQSSSFTVDSEGTVIAYSLTEHRFDIFHTDALMVQKLLSLMEKR